MPWFEQHKPNPDWSKRAMTLDSEFCMANCIQSRQPVLMESQLRSSTSMRDVSPDICAISAKALFHMAKQGYEIEVYWPQDLACNTEASLAAISPEDFDKFMNKLHADPPHINDIRKRIPEQYHPYIDRWVLVRTGNQGIDIYL
jgi:hypothetical protein